MPDRSQKSNITENISFGHTILTIPREILKNIFSYVAIHDWLSVFLTCKDFKEVAKASFDPSIQNNRALLWGQGFFHAKEKTSAHFQIEKKENWVVISELLKDKRVDPSINGDWVIRFASARGYIDLVRELLHDYRVDPSAGQNFAIRSASENGHVEVVKELLLDKRVDPSAENNWAIRFSSMRGRLAVAGELMKDKRVDPSADDCFALRVAAQRGYVKIIQLLLTDKRINSFGINQSIFAAAQNGSLVIVKQLLEDSRIDSEVIKSFAKKAALKNVPIEIVKELMSSQAKKTLSANSKSHQVSSTIKNISVSNGASSNLETAMELSK